MVARRTLTRATFVSLAAAVAAATALTGPSAAAAQPGSVDDQVAAADAELKTAQKQVADTYEAFSAAEKQYQDLNAAYTAAQGRAAQTRAEADAAAVRERDARDDLDEFAATSYRHGSAMFSARAYVGAASPSDLLDRASMLTVLAGQYGEVMDTAQVAVTDKAQADHDATAALADAEKKRDAAGSAKATAEQAYQAAVVLEDEAQTEVQQLADRRAALVAQSAPSSPAVTAVSGADVVLPVQGRLTSTYGPRGGTIHYGIDIANSIGTPIVSAMAGTVINSGPASGFGLWVRVQHAGGLITVYGHINESLVRVGQRVGAGEQIATLGNRGESTGPHLHFEVHQDGSKINPLPWLRSRGISI
ncbi:M23 family metallopeptidase [Actinophytocola oryzae]|uniref:Murein DD-endopeptidase MepM/ murein hydrolase activator NlpD n=1 Tax=Actinophytocola oryzae TaxID=502181 RepID=A0A4V3FUQ7_9PSEU|nr:peptidoglycan DD-metalloendopeptidase family protein [Actinophytocola oryzae]TDV56161.1 murein DD-endopeptidase MepM/ murein hydrolase activator NlpD [Actinophytocola oryzae]